MPSPTQDRTKNQTGSIYKNSPNKSGKKYNINYNNIYKEVHLTAENARFLIPWSYINTTINKLTVNTSEGVLDFADTWDELPDDWSLFIEDMVFPDYAMLKITNWEPGHTLQILVRDNGQKTLEALRHIAFLYGNRLVKTHFWRLSNGYYSLSPSTEAWTPLPEPTTYGSLFAAAGLGLWTWRKRRNRTHMMQSLKS